MAAINVLVVGDGPFLTNVPPSLGISFASSQDVTDDTFTVSEFVYLLRNNPVPQISVDTAHRRNDPNAKFANFNFATSTDLSQYDVIWLFGYEGWNYGATAYGSAIADNELLAITQFMNAGGGVFATGDHAGMGSLMCGRIPRVRSMRRWFGRAGDIPSDCPATAIDYNGATVAAVNYPGISNDPTPGVGRADTLRQNPAGDTATTFQFDDQSDEFPQTLNFPSGPVHSILQGPNGPISRFPDHMHEGEVVTPSTLSSVLVIGGQPFQEYPAVAGFQPTPGIIATGNILGGHTTMVDGSGCEQNNFSGDTVPTVSNTIGTLCAYDGRGAGVGRVVTDSSFHHYLDLNLIGDPCGSAPDRMQGLGPGYATPASGSALADLQSFYVNTVVWLSRVNQNFYFSVDKSTFGVDEASDGGTFPVYPSFWLAVDGYSPNSVQASLNSLAFAGPFASLGVISSPGTLAPESPGSPNDPQRVLIPFSVQFSGASMGAFPLANTPAKQMLLEATLSIGGKSYAAETTFELGPGEDPYFQNINPQASPPNPFYQSQDLCVFTVTPGLSAFPVPGIPVSFAVSSATDQEPTAAFTFITKLLNYMNGNTSFTTPSNTGPFASFPSQIIAAGDAAGDSSVTPFTPVGSQKYTNYNFAIVRVRLSGAVTHSAADVKVFFRLFITQTNDTDYEPNGTFLSVLDASGLPKEPLPAPDGETTPFFAGGSSAIDYATGGPNNQPITITNSAGAWHYFGCFLNVYDPSLNLKSMGTHHCIVAQIAYDDAPIVNSNGVTAGPENSDKLAQRNMQVTFSDNPGAPASHRIPQTFDLRPSPSLSQVTGQLLDYPDELMIDWGNTPLQSTASIYWPQVQAADVIKLAGQLYATQQLSQSDPNTLQCKVTTGLTYVPIPSGTGQNFAGLFTIDLPSTVVKGQEFNIVVRRISSRQIGNPNRTKMESTKTASSTGRDVQRNWRYVIGTFQVKIPVSGKKALLLPEENTYAILLWRLGLLSPSSRWYPVLQRYVSYIAARVNALGGNANGITPSPNGVGHSGGGVHPGPEPACFQREESTGKVAGLVYDRFGDFEGFFLITESGHELVFHSTEAEIEELVRFAWIDRVVISVLVREGHPERPVSIILRRAPRHPEH
jgi:hypothetical protein